MDAQRGFVVPDVRDKWATGDLGDRAYLPPNGPVADHTILNHFFCFESSI